MSEDIAVYLSVLEDSLESKEKVLSKLLELTQKQGVVLQEKEVDADEFEDLLDEKEKYLQKLQELDKGFESVFEKIGTTLKMNKQQYKPRIIKMQEVIRRITECSVKIQVEEKKNKELFASFVSGKRKEIREFNVNNKTAASYYQNMANQHHEWQTYFLDKKK